MYVQLSIGTVRSRARNHQVTVRAYCRSVLGSQINTANDPPQGSECLDHRSTLPMMVHCSQGGGCETGWPSKKREGNRKKLPTTHAKEGKEEKHTVIRLMLMMKMPSSSEESEAA